MTWGRFSSNCSRELHIGGAQAPRLLRGSATRTPTTSTSSSDLSNWMTPRPIAPRPINPTRMVSRIQLTLRRLTPDDELRRDVALANRIVHAAGLVSAFGHVSARLPGTTAFLVPTRASPALADPGRLLVLDVHRNVLARGGDANTRFLIHARLYAPAPT